MKIRFISSANTELDEAVRYYDHQLPGLGFRFYQEVDAAIERIKIKERKLTKKAIQDSQKKLLQRVKERTVDTVKEIRYTPPNTEKMSEIIIDYAKPLLDAAKNEEEQKRAITIAVTIWNLSLLPEDGQSECIKEIANIIGTSDRGGTFSKNDNEILNYLIKRKKVLFSEINRMVVDYEFVETPDDFHLNIVSTILEDRIQTGDERRSAISEQGR